MMVAMPTIVQWIGSNLSLWIELAKKYDFITIADWYQVAIENPNIWVGTDRSLHMETNGGGTLYNSQRSLDKAEKGPVKK